TDVSMKEGKKFIGKFKRFIENYVDDQLSRFESIRKDRIFITHSGVDEEIISFVYDLLKEKNYFEEIFITRASCTISSHCGPGTLGILFMTE
ncbi:MAG: DegV family protein, partial [Oscillospiraceae bacterium]|nr:DegV family protein [Oscillospiraceae bacterium]